MNNQTETSNAIKEGCPNCLALKSENASLKELLIELEQQAHYDVLTGLANRRYFIQDLETRIKRCERYDDVTALLFLDVDNLKAVNDADGHQAGDHLLTRLAQILADNVRSSDVVARIGGDEFAILLDNMDADQVDKKIASLIDRISTANVQYEGKELKMSAAMGYCFIGPKDTVPGLMSRADAAMYKAKNGRANSAKS